MTDMTKLVRLEESRTTEALEILTDAFAGDPLFKTWGVSRRLITKMFRHPLMTGFQCGDVFTVNGDLESIMIVTPSDKIQIAFQQFVRNGLLGSVIDILPLLFKKRTWPLLRALNIIEKDKKTLDIGPYIYLYILAIHQSGQGKGLGSFLMKTLCQQADKEGKAVYLETQTSENVRFYQKFGFEILKEIPVDNDFSLWEMVRFAK
ncbi:MAG: GNAT family N-acetyltransferase [Spirochaetales bacterium]|nr:GNAT family N-acetyltransferase [Spirochaetales bacterium]